MSSPQTTWCDAYLWKHNSITHVSFKRKTQHKYRNFTAMHLIPKGRQHFFSFECCLPQLQQWNSKHSLPYNQALRANCHEGVTITKLPAFWNKVYFLSCSYKINFLTSKILPLTLHVLLLKTSIFTGFSALDLRISFKVSLSWS